MAGKQASSHPPNHGVEQAYAEISGLFETHYARFTRYFLFHCGRPHEAEDMASELFDRALRAAGSLTPCRPAIESWLFTTARNMMVDYFRRKGRNGSPLSLDQQPDHVLAADTTAESDQEMDRSEALVRLAAAAEHLSEAQRTVLAMRFSDGLTGAQIARVLSKKPSAVREMQRVALEKLRNHLLR